jgi:hypothetical protein
MKTSTLAFTLATLLATAAPALADDGVAAVQKAYDLADWMKLVTPEEAGTVQGMSKKPQACLDALAAMKQAGKSDDDTIKLNQGTVTIADARATCEQALVDSQAFEGAVTGRETAERAEIEAIYKQAGIKGKRLELFVHYGKPDNGGWLARGCTAFVTDVKKLKKAKKLFHWFESDAGYVVRTYTFKGNSYKVSEKTYLTQAKAYRGCR